MPYILHPAEVAAIVSTMTDDEEVLAAALLHDTVEDAGVTPEQIRERFGARVADIVASETENKRRDLAPEGTWLIRKRESLDLLRQSTDVGVMMVWLGDKLANMRSFARGYRKEGDAVFLAFHEHDPARHAWYYRTVADIVSGALGGTDAYREYTALLDEVFSSVPKDK